MQDFHKQPLKNDVFVLYFSPSSSYAVAFVHSGFCKPDDLQLTRVFFLLIVFVHFKCKLVVLCSFFFRIFPWIRHVRWHLMTRELDQGSLRARIRVIFTDQSRTLLSFTRGGKTRNNWKICAKKKCCLQKKRMLLVFLCLNDHLSNHSQRRWQLTFHDSHLRYHQSLSVLRDCTKYVQHHSSMAIILFFENEMKLMETQTAHWL